MTVNEPDEGQYVADLIYGRGERPRSTAPEPSILCHLAARLCHDFSIEGVLAAADEFGRQGRDAPPWFALWEATFYAVAARADFVDYLREHTEVNAAYLRVVRTLQSGDRNEAQDLFQELIDAPAEIDIDLPPIAGAARLLPLLSRDIVENVLSEPEFDPGSLDAESVRSLLVAIDNTGASVPADWIERAIAGDRVFEYGRSRVAHLLPHLPAPVRAARADELARWFSDAHLPPSMRALAVSRIAPFVTSAQVWVRGALLDDLEDVWRAHIETLLNAGWREAPWADVMRAHPEHAAFATIRRPHETTGDAAEDIRARHQGALEKMEPPPAESGTRGGLGDDRGGTRGGLDDLDGPVAPQPAQTTPRRLQTDIFLEDEGQEVTAFVAGLTHSIDVSIGRGARVGANVAFDETVFEETDKDWLVLPVWFHAPGHKLEGKLRLPRDQSRNSTTAGFSFTAPDAGRVTARIHVMRPDGGMLLQSAALIGDVVADVEDAVAHTPGIELSVDVMAGDLQDPAPGGTGKTLIADVEQAVTEDNGALIEIDVSQVQSDLADRVREIETAADRQDLDPRAVAKKLVALAFAGQRLRGQFDAQLKGLKDANPLQIVSLRSGDVLPLELIYDGPLLSINSEICPTWQQALRDGDCGGCAGGGPEGDETPARVCPMKFWSMQKVIERRTADAHGSPFRVSAERAAGRPQLRPFEAAVVGASSRVSADDVNELRAFTDDTLKVPAEVASNWSDWREVIGARHPELLIAMPHNHPVMGGVSTALMLGEPEDEEAEIPPETALVDGAVVPELVQPSGHNPGPIVFLLGCNTQFDDNRLSSFAGAFRENGAALTVGTLGKLRADHAPRAAHVLLERLVKRDQNTKSVGDAVLQARRALLSEGMIMALLLVANGDAQWLLP